MLRRTKSLFGKTDSLFPTEQGIVGNALELLRKAAPEHGERRRIGQKFPKFPVIFPVIFPVLREFEAFWNRRMRMAAAPAILAKRNTPFYANDISALQRGAAVIPAAISRFDREKSGRDARAPLPSPA
jgi:hypothetical protein